MFVLQTAEIFLSIKTEKMTICKFVYDKVAFMNTEYQELFNVLNAQRLTQKTMQWKSS